MRPCQARWRGASWERKGWGVPQYQNEGPKAQFGRMGYPHIIYKLVRSHQARASGLFHAGWWQRHEL